MINPTQTQQLIPQQTASRVGREVRPWIQINNADLHYVADSAWEALAAANDRRFPEVLVRGSDLVYVSGGDGEPVNLKPYTKPTLRDRMSQTAQYKSVTARGQATVHPPDTVAGVLLEREPETYVGAPRVERVVDVPVFAPDESLVFEPGYHPTRLYYRPADEFADWEPHPGPDDFYFLDKAVDLVRDELLGDFPFAEEADQANAIALVLLPFARELISGPTPLHAVMAPEPGTGKTLLAKSALMPGVGDIAMATEPADAEEWRKQITSHLMLSPGAVVFDNVRHRIDSGHLARALTTNAWEDRVLGESKIVRVPVRNAWVATVNNATISTEMARRTVPIYLDARLERPWTRTAFRHANLEEWIRRNRRDLVWAALTLIQNWLDGGLTQAYERTGVRINGTLVLGSYGSWSTVMGGILKAAGINGFMDNHAKLLATGDEERDELATFLSTWAEQTQEPLEAHEVAGLVTAPAVHNPLRDALPTSLRGLNEETMRAKLPYYLRENKNRVAGGWRLEYVQSRRRRWAVRPVDAADTPAHR